MIKNILIKIWNHGFYFLFNFRHFVRNLVLDNKSSVSSEMAADLQKNGIIKFHASGLSEYLLPIIENRENLNKKTEEYYLIENVSNEYGIKGINVDIQSEFLWKHIFNK